MPIHRPRRLQPLCCVLLLAATSALAAAPLDEPEPVAAGLWRVQILTTFSPDPEPGAAHWPGLAKPRAGIYRVCIDANRARAPMGLSGDDAHRVVTADPAVLLVRDEGSAANSPTSEQLYRRLNEHEFEGSNTLAMPGATSATEMTTQYRATYLQADCGDVRPRAASKFGEP